jgi:hypothetical protein
MKLAAFLFAAFAASALGQGVNLNGVGTNSAPGSYTGVGGSGSTSAGQGGFVWGIGSREDGGGSALGRNNNAFGTDSHVTGQGVWVMHDNGVGEGWANFSNGMQGRVMGHQANDRAIRGARAYAIGAFSCDGDCGRGVGDAQRIELMVRATTVGAASMQLSSSNNGAGISPNITVMVVPDNGSMRLRGSVVARDLATGASKSWDFKALARRGVGAASVVLVGATVTPEFSDASASAWTLSVFADVSRGSIAVVGNGEAGKTIQWAADEWTVENVGGGGTAPPPGLAVATASLPVGTVGTVYSETLASTGGTPPYSWNAAVLPAGLALSGANIGGTPTASGQSTVLFTVTDSVSATANASLLMTINDQGAPPPTQLANASFESPFLSGGYQYRSAGAFWVFSGNSGVAANNSAFHPAPAPDGVQCAFVQMMGTVSQTVTLAAGSYTLSFKASARPQQGPNAVTVALDGAQIGATVTPPSSQIWTAYSIPFAIAADGPHTISFAGQATTDLTTFVDAVTIQ